MHTTMSTEYRVSAADRLRNGFLSSAESLLSAVRTLENIPSTIKQVGETAEQMNRARLPEAIERTTRTIQIAALGGVAVMGIVGIIWAARGGGHRNG